MFRIPYNSVLILNGANSSLAVNGNNFSALCYPITDVDSLICDCYLLRIQAAVAIFF
jgi:hypothetical protein